MDERKLQKLKELFDEYDIHPECIQEIIDLVVKSGKLNAFYRIFNKNTEYLRRLSDDIYNLSNFEKLKDATDLYSMHIKNSQMNLRIIYSDKSGKIALLLCCFYEKSDSKDTYRKHIPIAKKRLKEMEENDGKEYE